MRRWILLLALGFLPGCDVATAALLFSQDKGSDDDSPPLVAPGPGFTEPVFQAWTALIPDSAAADAERLALFNAGGEPSTSTWTFIGNAAATDVFDPLAPPTDINAILILVSSTENYLLDSIEILDGQNTVIEHASGLTYSSSIGFPDNIIGPPDLLFAETNAVDTTRAFIFTIFTGPIDRFRINVQGETQPLVPGDLTGIGTYDSIGSQRPGGLAIDANGLIHLTLSVGDTGWLIRYDLAGAMQDEVEIDSDLATAGIHSVALNSAGVIFTAASLGAGVIQVRRFEPDLTAGNIAGFSSGINGDRVEHNSIAIDSSGNVVVVGGFSSLLSGRNHWRVKIPDTVTGSPLWQNSASQDSSSATYWHAVTAGANEEVFMTGDILSALLGGTNQIYTGQFNAGGVATWDDEYVEGEQPADVGHSIAVDATGNVFIGGSVGTDSDGRDGVILRYTAGGGSVSDEEYVGPAGLDDEILDIAVDTDGAIYAVGYTTLAGQGEDWWIRKYNYDPVFNTWTVIWARTHHGGNGNDRAVSVALTGTKVVVAGYETNGTSQTKLVLRVYEK